MTITMVNKFATTTQVQLYLRTTRNHQVGNDARSRCRSHPDEVRTWIVRKDKSLQVRWKLLPLHAAIIFQAPNFLVSTLLEKYPGAASRKDDQGMLPLHLAFRHKQEDEDLLELLLVHFPKAVLIKDRRDRVPLEHGRESKFSAKLMRLYSDSTVLASRTLSGQNKHGNSASDDLPTGCNLTGAQRTALEAEYKEKILAVKVDYEKQIRKLKTQMADLLSDTEQKGQEKVLAVKGEYENEIRTIKESHDRRISSIHDHHTNKIRQLEQGIEEERQSMIEQHNDEVNGLRELLANQVAKDKDLTDKLEKEITHLQIALQERRTECEVARGQYEQLQSYNNDLRDTLCRTTNHQLQLQEMLAFQQEQIEKNRTSRYKLVQTLLRHEDDHGEAEQQHGAKMIDLFDKIRRKIDYAREKGMIQDGDDDLDFNSKTRGFGGDNRVLENRIDSRMDRERGEEEVEPRFRELVERDDDVHNHDRLENNHRIDNSMNDKNQEQEYGEVRILADEISAITDNSDF